MPKKILIDAAHEEETRVVVLENGLVQEFESETQIKKQVKGNIYLAKVTRVEPSLQSAFIEYGENRHGFLPFSEIHPDYYNIPISDKKELLDAIKQSVRPSDNTEETQSLKEDSDSNENPSSVETSENIDVNDLEVVDEEKPSEISSVSDFYKKYKIQEVIKRGQVILVQVEKEERGNKGASVTTFISLAGRFCVLMPNSLRKGGVSRRVSNYEDRKRLKKVISTLSIPEEAGIIIRTAGAKKEADELEKDYNYLAELWNKIRQTTLESVAPAFIHAEGDLLKRTIRDMFNDQIDDIFIAGRKPYEVTRDFIKSVSPENIAKIKEHRSRSPIFTKHKVEEQIAKLYSCEAALESGGAIVINPTEALISVDVNSGKSTAHRNIESTALSNNLEAAKEIARQARLRDLSGLIVIDFIDMSELKNRKAVERKLKESFANDKAKIQIGRISNFGLLEMSRQRMHPNFLEINTTVCSTCSGNGYIKAPESTAITVLRAIESDISKKGATGGIEVSVSSEVAIYIINNKRLRLTQLENRYGIKIYIKIDKAMWPDGFATENIGGEHNIEKEVYTAKKSKSKKEDSAAKDKDIEKPNQPKKAFNFLEGLWRKLID